MPPRNPVLTPKQAKKVRRRELDPQLDLNKQDTFRGVKPKIETYSDKLRQSAPAQKVMALEYERPPTREQIDHARELSRNMQDITAPGLVQVNISADRKILWVNIDGVCVLRACRISKLELSQPK
jgi:hypothetical protein